MNTERPAALALGGQDHRKWYRTFCDDVDLNNEELTKQRLEQWRPFWQNPFATPKLGLTFENNHSQTLAVDVGGDDEKGPEKPEMSRADTGLSQLNSVSQPVEVVHTGPAWVHLFYDLAWTATFSELTQNGTFNGGWDNLSYVTFFLLMWWLWASQTLYSIHFYTNDWVHLFSIFVQLIIFGLLAATTHGYDVTMYILKSPGTDKLDPQTLDEMRDPERYRQDRIASHSLITIAFCIAASRTVHWLQHLLAWIQACRTSRTRPNLRIPLKLRVLPFALFIIALPFYWTVAGLTCNRTTMTKRGAKDKFWLWGFGLLAEIVLHGVMEWLDWIRIGFGSSKKPATSHSIPPHPELLKAPPQSPTSPVQPNEKWPVPRSNVSLRERLEGITTVVIGEGLNKIAGTLYTIISVPGITRPVAISITCAAIILYSLAYFYFEGPTGHRDLNGSNLRARKVIWLLLHFPFMLSIILLLLGVKNQFLMTSYLATSGKTFEKFDNVISAQDLYLDDPASGHNMPLKNFLLKRGLVWADEFDTLNTTITHNGSIPMVEVSEEQIAEGYGIWSNQMALKIMVNLYGTFMGGNQSIDADLHQQIQEYYSINNTLAFEDYNNEHNDISSVHYLGLISRLLDGHVLGARFITGLAGLILVSLGLMNAIHSTPRDRFQWGAILTRISTGSALLLLELLNIGHYQTLWVIEDQVNQRAGVIRWIWAWWVLPTLAFAFGADFVIELIILRFAGLAIERKRGNSTVSPDMFQ